MKPEPADELGVILMKKQKIDGNIAVFPLAEKVTNNSFCNSDSSLIVQIVLT